MGRIKRFEIEFSNSNGAFYAGQPVTGNVILELNEPIKAKSIKMQFCGDAFVSFTEKQPKKRQMSDRQKYFDQLDVLFGSGDTSLLGDSAAPLNAGLHTFPFYLTTSANLPSSFEHNDARVRYWCRAVVKMPLLSRDQSAKKAFTIVGLRPLDREAMAFTPVRLSSARPESSVGLFSCTSGALTCDVRLSRAAFVPGESVLVNADIQNATGKRVKVVEAWIQQNLILKTRSGAKRFYKGEQKIAHVKYGGIKPKNEQIWRDEKLKLPPLPPTDLATCQLISVEYLFNFHVGINGLPPILMSHPIVVGTIPLPSGRPAAWGDAPVQRTAASVANAPPRPPPPYTIACGMQQPEQQPAYAPGDHAGGAQRPEPSAPPPSYSECALVGRILDVSQCGDQGDADTDDVGTARDRGFAPLYPIYELLQ